MLSIDSSPVPPGRLSLSSSLMAHTHMLNQCKQRFLTPKGDGDNIPCRTSAGHFLCCWLLLVASLAAPG